MRVRLYGLAFHRETLVIPVDAKQFKATRRHLRLSANSTAKLVGASNARTIRRWEAGERDIAESAIAILAVLEKMTDAERAAYMTKKGIKQKPIDTGQRPE